MSAHFRECLAFLRKKNIKVQSDWVDACLEWIIEENGAGQSSSALCNLVYEQWLMADLSEIAEPSFSPNIRNFKGSLSGTFCVQVNSFMDIGHSAYSQIQKLKGVEIDYDETDDDTGNEAKEFFKKSSEEAKLDSKPKNAGKWKENSSRMLFMELFDGMQTINAIEYTPINKLNIEELEPGCKVQLVGPIHCRDCMLLLKSENINMLGGNVESLMESKTQMQILSDKLSLQEDAKPKVAVGTGLQKKMVGQAKQNDQSANSKTSRANDKEYQKKATNQTNQNNRSMSSKTSRAQQAPPDQHQNINTPRRHFDDIIMDDLKNGGDMFFKDVAIGNVGKTKATNVTRKDSDVVIADDLDDDFFGDDIDIVDEPKRSTKATSAKNRAAAKIDDNLELENEFLNDVNFDEDLQIAGNERKTVRENEGLNINDDDAMLADHFEDDFFTDDVDIFEAELPKKTTVNVKPQPRLKNKSIVNKGVLNTNTEDGLGIMEISGMINRSKPIKGKFKVKGSFKTLVSRLRFDDGYRLLAVMTDGEDFLKVLIGNTALVPLIGFEASTVRAAIANHTSLEQKQQIKEALKVAEKSLEMNKWCLVIEFNKEENIYEVINMTPLEEP